MLCPARLKIRLRHLEADRKAGHFEREQKSLYSHYAVCGSMSHAGQLVHHFDNEALDLLYKNLSPMMLYDYPKHSLVELPVPPVQGFADRKSTRLNSSHVKISYAVFCLKKKIND